VAHTLEHIIIILNPQRDFSKQKVHFMKPGKTGDIRYCAEEKIKDAV